MFLLFFKKFPKIFGRGGELPPGGSWRAHIWLRLFLPIHLMYTKTPVKFEQVWGSAEGFPSDYVGWRGNGTVPPPTLSLRNPSVLPRTCSKFTGVLLYIRRMGRNNLSQMWARHDPPGGNSPPLPKIFEKKIEKKSKNLRNFREKSQRKIFCQIV